MNTNGKLEVYLSGEIHTDWRDIIQTGCLNADLPVSFSAPETSRDLSDSIGEKVFGSEPNKFWYDHRSAKINAIRNKVNLEKADLVIVRFGDQYRQWNAAFDAGLAAAKGKPVITLHDEFLDHALKEIDAAALAVARKPEELVQILSYVCRTS